MITSLFKRTISHFSGLVLGKILSTIVFIFVARNLQPERFGELMLFLTVIQLSTVLADFGLKQWFQKQQSVQIEKAFSQTVAARIFVWFIASICIAAFFSYFRPFSLSISLIILAATIPEALNSIAEAYYLKLKQSFKVGLRTPSLMIVFLIAWTISGFSLSVPLLLLFWFLGSLVTMVWFFPFSKIDISLQKIINSVQTLKKSGDYALLTTTALAYSRADQLTVQYFQGSFALGLYGAAYRYLDTLSLLPSAVTQNLFSDAAENGKVSHQQLKKITLISFGVGVLIASVMYLSADFLSVGLLGQDYRGATILVKIFSLVLLLFFVNAPLASIVQSSDYVRRFLPFGILNTVLNVVLNIIFVPLFGVIASAYIMIITEFTGMLINIYFVNKIYQITTHKTVELQAKPSTENE